MDRFWSKVIATTIRGCWRWGAAIARNGYGRFTYEGQMREAHRVSWALAFNDGVLPSGKEIDHVCRNRACVNPRHLQIVPVGWNAKQGGQNRKAHFAAAATCRRGHAWTPENTMRQKGGRHRMCRACARVSNAVASKRYRSRRKGEVVL